MPPSSAAATTVRSDSPWRRLLGRLGLDVRPGEGVVATLLFVLFFAAITFQYISKPVRQGTFVDTLGAERLPLVYLVLAIFAIPAILLYNRGVDRLHRHHVLAATCAVVAGSVVAFSFVIGSESRWVPFAFYIWISIAYVMIVSQFWAYSNYLLDPRQGKRLFGFIGAGGITGGLLGSLIARFVSGSAGTQVTVLVSAAVLFAAIPMVYVVHHFAPTASEIRERHPRADKVAQARGGLQAILGSRHLQLIAALMFVTVVVANIVDVQFAWAMDESVPDTVVSVDANTTWDPAGNVASIEALSAALEAGEEVEIEGVATTQPDGALAATRILAWAGERDAAPEGATGDPPPLDEPPEEAIAAGPEETAFRGKLAGVDEAAASLTIEREGRLDDLTGGFGDFYAIMNTSALLFQLLFTARIHRRLGVGFAMRVLPVTMALGTTGLFVAAAAFPRALLAVSGLLKIGENGIRYSLDQATRELLFLPVPSKPRFRAKAYIDVFIQRFAKGVSATFVLIGSWLLGMNIVQVGWFSLAIIAVWLGVTVAMRSQFVRSFRDGLRARSGDTKVPIDLSDVTSLEVMVESLGNPDPRQVLNGLDMLDYHGKANLVPPVLLRHESPEVKQRTLELLAETSRADALGLIEEVLGDPSPDVRAAALHALVALQSDNVSEIMTPRLHDPDLRVRAAAIASVLMYGEGAEVEEAGGALAELTADADPEARRAAACSMAELEEPNLQESLVQLLYDEDLAVQCEAVAAVRARVERGGGNPIFVPILIALTRDRRLKHEAREALVAYGEAVIPALVHFMNDPQEQMWVRRAIPKTVARVGGTAAAEALMNNLDASDQFLRRKVIESLSWLSTTEPGLDFGEAKIAAEIYQEARRYFLGFTDLLSIAGSQQMTFRGPVVQGRGSRLLLVRQLFADRMLHSVEVMFGMLALVHSPVDVRAAFQGLMSDDPALRSHALEYLDNTLSGEIHRAIFAVINDEPLAEKLRIAKSTFDLSVQPAQDVLRRLVLASSTEDEDAYWLGSAAVHAICVGRLEDLYPQVVDAAKRADGSLVEETAIWATRQLGLTPT